MARPKRKMSQAATIEALKAAVEDVRINGREGRTVQQVADKYGVKIGSLRTKISEAGLTVEACKLKRDLNQVAIEAESPSPESPNPESSVCNSLHSNLVSSSPTKSVENWANEGCAIGVGTGVITGAQSPAPLRDLASDAAISAIKEEVVKECKRMIREARRQVEIKNVRDYKTVVDLALDMLGASKEASKQSPLIQVQILGDSGNREPRLVRAIEAKSPPIKDTGNDCVDVEAEFLDT
jgi:hypothetical protein